MHNAVYTVLPRLFTRADLRHHLEEWHHNTWLIKDPIEVHVDWMCYWWTLSRRVTKVLLYDRMEYYVKRLLKENPIVNPDFEQYVKLNNKMKLQAKIASVGEERHYQSQHGEGVATPVTLLLPGEQYEESIVADTTRLLNKQAIESAIADGRLITVYVNFAAREYQGRNFNNVRVYLPQEYYA